MQDAGGARDQRRRPERAERLHRLAETHVVGEERTQAGLGEEAEPVHAVSLIRPELTAEVLWQLSLRQLGEAFGELAQAREVRRRRAAQELRQSRHVRRRGFR